MASIGSSRPQLKSKFSDSYAALLQGNQPWLQDGGFSSSSSSPSFNNDASARPAISRSKSSGKSNTGPRSRYFADLLCLPVETQFVIHQLNAIPPETLLDDDPRSKGAHITDNVGSLWREAIRVWRESDEDEVRRRNAVDTLVALSYPILNKRFSNYPFDIISIFAGGMDEADDVFTLLVDSIDDTLRGGNLARVRIPSSVHDDDDDEREHAQAKAREWIDDEVQHRALQLGLLWLSCVAQTSLAAYILRRDLFVTASTFISTSAGSRYAYEGAVLLGLLATIGQGTAGGISLNVSTSNPYARRFRDWVDEECMAKILVAASAAMDQNVQFYRQVADDSPPTLTGSIAGLATMRWISSLAELVNPPNSPAHLAASDRQTPAASTLIGDFSHLPSSSSVILLPFFLLSRTNQAFTSLILDVSDPANTDSNQAPSAQSDVRARAGDESFCHLASLASYLATHASVSPRSASYARISLLCLLVFLYDPRGSRNMLANTHRSAHILSRIRICRQREPALALPRTKRVRLVTAVLDAATCSLRYNLSKRIDMAAYLISLKLIQRVVILCSDERIQLEYDWQDCWSAILALASFLAARFSEIRSSRDLSELIKALIATLNSILLRSDHFLASTNEINHFIYEILRCSQTLRKTVLLLDPMSRETCLNLDSGPSIPVPPKLHTQVPGWKNLERVMQAVEAKINEWVGQKPSSRRNKTPDINTIAKLIASIDREHMLAGATEDHGPTSSALNNGIGYASGIMHHELEWLDRIQEQCLPEFVRHACADVLRILPIY
ncbi:uncharacterized protein MEPE_02518 [Melanopsichium pennsylvanicum]|uniref:Armadillo-like helical domain-containing protein n=2 Tax=Melanopsichium pennsylvanicum TaxID=63383 RepID=A0AAJ4XJU5_9BASI|nr:conserved hypothetical protein [Melanopsichium pennsylvanicum 4]SNX83810.1 uncharacterized protein MEPE_02518 [Melanopsichium pennsylvanicum]